MTEYWRVFRQDLLCKETLLWKLIQIAIETKRCSELSQDNFLENISWTNEEK